MKIAAPLLVAVVAVASVHCGETGVDCRISSASALAEETSAMQATSHSESGEGGAQAFAQASASTAEGGTPQAGLPSGTSLPAMAGAGSLQAGGPLAGLPAQVLWPEATASGSPDHRGAPAPTTVVPAPEKPAPVASAPNASSGAPAAPPTSATAQPSTRGSTDTYSCPSDGSDPHAEERKACVAAINGYRATLSLAPLKRWCEQTQCTDGQAQQDLGQRRAHSAFGKCGESAQNECPDWSTPVSDTLPGCLKQMWAEGPGPEDQGHGHYVNMSSTKYTAVECGIFVSGNLYWSVQDFH